ncbi:hypothetical protein [uncultured Methanolobus sp.]|uniref:hypothetical protein n=1 Tax=uncultured Methanolobus sp. TaxID=218300 RepID=UPI0029C8C087|nr:hypothetical protein [uncultured Methanolobus sp.]
MTTLSGIDESEVTEVSIRNGLSGESGTIDNTIEIEKLISILDNYSLEEFYEESYLNGYRHFFYFYTDSGNFSRVSIVDNNTVQVDRVLYNVINSPIDLVEIEEFIDSSSNSKSAPSDDGLNVEVSGLVEFLSTDDLVSQSDIIITGTVTGAYPSRWNTPDGQRPDKADSELDIGTEDMIYTHIGIHVSKYLKNPLDTGDLQITIDGGTVGDDSIWVEDSPSFEYGENVLLFLDWTPGREGMTVTGGYQGKFTMINDTAAVRGDGMSVTITEKYDHWAITEI